MKNINLYSDLSKSLVDQNVNESDSTNYTMDQSESTKYSTSTKAIYQQEDDTQIDNSNTFEINQENVQQQNLSKQNFLSQFYASGSMYSTTIILIMSILGSIILIVPITFYYSGWLASIVIYSFVAWINYYTNMLLIYCSDATGCYSYSDIAKRCMGNKMIWFVKQNKLSAATIQQISPSAPFFLRDPEGYFWSALTSLFIIFPICCSRTFDQIRIIYYFGILITIYTIIFIVYMPFTENPNILREQWSDMKVWKWAGIFKTFPIALYTYILQNNVMNIYFDLKQKSPKRMSKCLKISTYVTTICYIIAGFFGYIQLSDQNNLFFAKVHGDIIILADYASSFALILVIVLSNLSVIITVPTNLLPNKLTFLDIIFPNRENHSDSTKSHTLTIFIQVLVSLLPSLFFSRISDIATLIGSTSSPLVCYTIPAVFYLRICKDRISKTKKLFLWGFLIVFTTIFGIYNAFDFFFGWTDQIYKDE